ncbi:MAG: hypothetical protein V1850_00045 [Candidatus Bathyarchaeota archaeon]
MENKPSIFVRLMNEALSGIDPYSLPHLRVGPEWTGIQVLTDPFVIYRRDRYLPVVLVEELGTELKHLHFISAVSLAKCLEPIRAKRGTLVGVNIRMRKKGEERFSTYEVEELVD